MLRASRFLLVLLALAGLALLSAIVTMHFAIHGAEVTVPSFKGLTVEEATSKAASLGLNLSVENHFFSADVPAGHISGQSPVPGTVVRRQWHVQLTESLGPQRIAVPNLLGLDLRVASIELRGASLDLGSIARLPWAYASEGSIIGQNPAAGAAGVARPSVNLLLAAPSDRTTPAYIMPNLVGQQFAAAKQAIAQAGLPLAPEIGAPAAIPSVPNSGLNQPMQPVVPSGTITSQFPAPGARVDGSTPIRLTVVQ
jgi:beta-lactam-binding protein with PASTA domain